MYAKRLFIVGSEWVYYNIYVGPQSSDLVLIDVIKPFAEKLISKQIIDKWFFIRYKDENGKMQFAHSLNGSSLALPRILACLLENHQTVSGIAIPAALQPYFGAATI